MLLAGLNLREFREFKKTCERAEDFDDCRAVVRRLSAGLVTHMLIKTGAQFLIELEFFSLE